MFSIGSDGLGKFYINREEIGVIGEIKCVPIPDPNFEKFLSGVPGGGGALNFPSKIECTITLTDLKFYSKYTKHDVQIMSDKIWRLIQKRRAREFKKFYDEEGGY